VEIIMTVTAQEDQMVQPSTASTVLQQVNQHLLIPTQKLGGELQRTDLLNRQGLLIQQQVLLCKNCH